MTCVTLGTLGPDNACVCCKKCSRQPCECCPACRLFDCICLCGTCGLQLKDKCTCCKRCFLAFGACTCCERCKRTVLICDCCSKCESFKEDCSCPCKTCEKKPCECCTGCQEAPTQCKCICEVCLKLKLQCDCCKTCRKFPCSKCSRCKTRPCQCCTRCSKLECICCKKCRAAQCVCVAEEAEVVEIDTSQDTPVTTPKTNTAQIKPVITMAQGLLEPPDISILKDQSQLEFYLTALESWEDLQDCGGYPANKRAAVILTCAFKTYPELCKQMSEHFKKTLKDKEDGVEQISDWLRTKFGLNKHADIVRVLNKWLNTTRNKNESLLDYITRFETAHNELANLGETLSSTFKAVLLLRQADLTDTDQHIITVNIDLNPKAAGSKKHFEDVKDAMRKFQHTRQANASIKGASAQPTKTYLAAFLEQLEADGSLEEDTKYNIHTYAARQFSQAKRGGKSWTRRPGGGGGGGGGRGGGHGGAHGGRVPQHGDTEVKFWKCVYCICNHRRWERCGCPCTTHKKEHCPNPDQAKVQKERNFQENKRKNEGAKEPEEKKAKPAEPERGYYSYMRRLDDLYGEDNTDATFLAKLVSIEDRSEPLPLNILLEELGVITAPPPPSDDLLPLLTEDEDDLGPLPLPPAEQNYDEVQQVPLVLHRSAGALTKVRSSKDSSILTDRNLFYETSAIIHRK